MSHIVTIKTQIKDSAALAAACRRLGLEQPVQGTAKLYGSEAQGLLVRLPGWRYPLVADPATSQLHFDNYNGAWGSQGELDKLLQAYAIEKAKTEARKAGHGITEQALSDGSVKLTVSVAGGQP
jgi:hypothetical protein